jgi:hypothetical protein
MIVNFRTRKINQGTRKLTQTSTLIKKIKINTTLFKSDHFQVGYLTNFFPRFLLKLIRYLSYILQIIVFKIGQSTEIT